MKKALDDLVVLDFSRYIAGPYAARMLAQLGAYVIKVEKSYVGEDFRMYPPFFNGESLSYPSCNLNKHCIGMDLRNDTAKEILTKLLPHVDILIQNFRAGTIEKMGFDWETIHAINPRLIMANNSGFGQYGPYSKRVAFDSIIQSEAGVINSVAEENGGTPCYPGGNNSDHMGALSLISAILAAVNERDRTGEGQYLEVDMMSAVCGLFSADLALYGATGEPQKIHNFAPCGYYRDADGKFIQISCPEQHWNNLKQILAIPELNQTKFDDCQGRRTHKEELDQLIQQWTIQHKGDWICETLEADRIGAAIVRDYKDILVNEHALSVDALKKIEVPYVGEVPYPDIPFRLSDSPMEFVRAPKIGEHNAEILEKFLGMTSAEVAELEASKVLYRGEHAGYQS